MATTGYVPATWVVILRVVGLLSLIVSSLAQDIVAGSTLAVSTMSSASSTSSSSTSSAAIPTHTVIMGQDGFSLTPQTTTASVGDIIEYRFYFANHSVAQAAYLSPCQPLEVTTDGAKIGFWSGFKPVAQEISEAKRPVYRVRVNDTQPIWFYCSAPDACIENQMLGVVNPNSSETLIAQIAAAKTVTVQLSPGDPLPVEGLSPTTSMSSPTSTSRPTSSPTTVVVAPNSSSLSGGAIAGIVIGGVAVATILLLLFFLWGKVKGITSSMKYSHSTKIGPILPSDASTGYKEQPTPAGSPYQPTFAAKAAYVAQQSPPLHHQDSWQTVPAGGFVPVRSMSPEVQQGHGLMSEMHENQAYSQSYGNSVTIQSSPGEAPWSPGGFGLNERTSEMGGEGIQSRVGSPEMIGDRPNNDDTASQNLGPHELDARSSVPETPRSPPGYSNGAGTMFSFREGEEPPPGVEKVLRND